MYLAITLTTATIAEIGRRFGRDHTTVMHARKKVTNLVNCFPPVAAEILELKKQLGCA
jgi:chromosomal replication initiator protein